MSLTEHWRGNVEALSNQRRVLAALLKQEFLQHVETRGISFALSVVEPLLHISVIVSWHSLMRVQPIYGPSTLLFVSTGIAPVFLFIQLSSQLRSASALYTGARRFAAIQLLDIMAIAAFYKVIVQICMSLVLFGSMYLFLDIQDAMPSSVAPMLVASLQLICLGIGVGLINAAVTRIFHLWHFIYAPLSRLQIVFAGILFVPDFLIPNVRSILDWNPVMHSLSMFRRSFYPQYPALLYDGHYVWSCAAAALAVGLVLERLTRNHG